MVQLTVHEPTLAEILADPIIQDVMRRDGVRREQIIALFNSLWLQRQGRAA